MLDDAKTLAQGGLLIWPALDRPLAQAMLNAFCRETCLPMDRPLGQFTLGQRSMLLHGLPNREIVVFQSDLVGESGPGKKQETGVENYEKTGLQQAALIIKNASIAYKQGQISYLEWIMLMNNAVTIELSYLQAIQQYNNTLIEINYLTGN